MGKDVDMGAVADMVADAMVSAAMDIPDRVILGRYSATRGVWRVVAEGGEPGTVKIAVAMHVSNDVEIIDGCLPTVIISPERLRLPRDDMRAVLADHLPPAGAVRGLGRMVGLLHDAVSSDAGRLFGPMLSAVLVSMWPGPGVPWEERGTYGRPAGPIGYQPMVAGFRDVLADTALDDGLPDGFVIQDLRARLDMWRAAA